MSKAVIVGGGMFGLGAGVELRHRGWDVVLLNPVPIPDPRAASTDVSKLVRLDYGADEIYTSMAEAARAGWLAWNDDWGDHSAGAAGPTLSRLYHEDGLLVLTAAAMQPGEFELESFRLLSGRGYPVERLTSALLAQRFPAWCGAADGYLNPCAGWVESGAVVTRLAAEARRVGVEIRDDTGVSGLSAGGDVVRGAITGRGEVVCGDIVIVAAGAWSTQLVPELGGAIAISAHPIFHLRPPRPEDYQPHGRPSAWAADIPRTGWYGFPALPDGTVKIAQHAAGWPVHPDDPRVLPPAEHDRLRAFLRQSLPALAEAPLVESRWCAYSDSWDGDFYIDRVPGRRGLVVASGGSGHAFKFAPVLGALVADVVEGKPNPWASRFAWRAPGARRREVARAGDGG